LEKSLRPVLRPAHLTLSNVGEVLTALKFVNCRYPACEPPEWPR
jgi:hypothetical protein